MIDSYKEYNRTTEINVERKLLLVKYQLFMKNTHYNIEHKGKKSYVVTSESLVINLRRRHKYSKIVNI